MNHEHFLKSTREEVKRMLELHKKGKSSVEIGEILHKDHSSVLYWFRKVGLNNIYVENFDPRDVIINIVKKEKIEKKVCKFCKGKKSKRWKNTKYCCMLAWHEERKNKRGWSNYYW